MRNSKLNLVSHIDQATSQHLIFSLVNLSERLNTRRVCFWELYLSNKITIHLAEVIVVKLSNIWHLIHFTTSDASWIFTSDSYVAELHRTSLKYDHTFGENVFFSKAKNNFSYFQGLNLPYKSRHHAKDTTVRAICHSLRG